MDYPRIITRTTRVILYMMQGTVIQRIILSTIQINSLGLLYGFEWDKFMNDFMQLQTSITTIGTTYLNWKCLTGSPSYPHL